MEDYKKIVGRRITYLRKKKKIPVPIILDKMDVARSTYTGWITGRRTPKGETLVKLAELFETTVDFLTGNIDDEKPPKQEILDLITAGKVTFKGEPITEEQAEKLNKIITALLQD